MPSRGNNFFMGTLIRTNMVSGSACHHFAPYPNIRACASMGLFLGHRIGCMIHLCSQTCFTCSLIIVAAIFIPWHGIQVAHTEKVYDLSRL